MAQHHKSRGPTQRMLRVGELVRHALSGLLTRGEVDDPTLDGVTVTVPEVRMSPDLKLAKVYVMPLGGGHAEDVAAALNRNAKFIRGRITPEINLKFSPELRFYVDTSFDEADRIEALLKSEKVRRDLDDDAGPDNED